MLICPDNGRSKKHSGEFPPTICAVRTTAQTLMWIGRLLKSGILSP